LFGLVVAVVLPRLRPRLAGLSVLGLAAGVTIAWMAEQSGQALADRVGLPRAHARYGELVPVAAIVALIVAAIWWRLQRGPSIPRLPSWSTRVAGVAVLVVAVLTTGLTVLTGHSGALATWEAKGQAAAGLTAAESPTARADRSPTSAASSGGGSGYTMAEIAKHNSRTDCWSVIEGKAYNLTPWISQHPGGQGVILGMCGVDATAAFRGKHGTAPAPADALAGFALGPLSAGGPAVPTPAPTAAPTATAAATTRYTRAEVARHNNPTNCWSIVNGKVYDLTAWVSRHPGGQEAIAEMCGTNGAGEFLERHTGDTAANEVLSGYQIGVLA
jgi:cytochrome b involved in lipid metabolism/branched-subunit amino acid transport protein